jgi:hypothetical protein
VNLDGEMIDVLLLFALRDVSLVKAPALHLTTACVRKVSVGLIVVLQFVKNHVLKVKVIVQAQIIVLAAQTFKEYNVK